MTLTLHSTAIAGVQEVTSAVREDARGHFVRLFCRDTLAGMDAPFTVAQANLSVTHRRGTTRGFHLQLAPAAEAKLVRCVRGRIFDVAVDLRAGSPTFGMTHCVVLDEHIDRALLIPEGVAHGFQSLLDNAHVLYLHSSSYAPECDSGVRHDDPAINVAWPLPVATLSERDATLPSLVEWCATHMPHRTQEKMRAVNQLRGNVYRRSFA